MRRYDIVIQENPSSSTRFRKLGPLNSTTPRPGTDLTELKAAQARYDDAYWTAFVAQVKILSTRAGLTWDTDRTPLDRTLVAFSPNAFSDNKNSVMAGRAHNAIHLAGLKY